MGGGSNSAPPADVPPGGGIYPNTDAGTAFDFKTLGAGIAKAGQTYALGAKGGTQGEINYGSGSGSPYIGGGKVMSADSPQSYQIPVQQQQTSDFQKQYYQLINQIFQSYQQRVQNEGLSPQPLNYNF